jgi:endonuclease YncB( thermonuclease family)
MNIDVKVGCSEKDEKHCSDGDSVYVTGSAVNKLVRLAGIDACEVRGLSLYYLKKSGFLTRLKKELQEWLNPRLTKESIKLSKQLGFKAKEYLQGILEDELVLSLGPQVFDRYERPLGYLGVEDQDSYNYKMIETGLAIPYFIYPNAVSYTEKGEFNYDKLENFRDAAVKAREDKLGLWGYIDSILLPMELRYLTRREFPAKFCADFEVNILYSPQFYFKVPIENRIFFYWRDVVSAVLHGFRPARDCPGWVHKAWKVLHTRKYLQKEW